MLLCTYTITFAEHTTLTLDYSKVRDIQRPTSGISGEDETALHMYACVFNSYTLFRL